MSTNFEDWVFSVNFGDSDLYLKHSPYMKIAYYARNKEIEVLQEEFETLRKERDEAVGVIEFIATLDGKVYSEDFKVNEAKKTIAGNYARQFLEKHKNKEEWA